MKTWKEVSGIFPQVILKYKYVLLIIAAGALLLLLPLSGSGKTTAEEAQTIIYEDFDVAQEEVKIQSILSEMAGVGKVSVMLTVKTGMETVYASDESQSVSRTQNGDSTSYSSDSDSKPATVSSSGEDSPLLIKRVYPEYQGILIVCEGADNATVCLSIVNAMTAILDIGADKVTITKMKG